MVIVPSIDLRHGKVVRLQQGDYARQLNYALDPLETAHKFAAAGAKWMHIVDLDGAKAGQPVQTDLIASIIAKSGMTIQVGGGVREISHIDRLMQAGAERIVIGTRAMEDWNWFNSLVHNPVYSGRIVLALDARGGDVAVQGWTKSAGRSALDVAKEVSDWPLAAILYTDVAKDGMLEGPNIETTRALAEAGKVPVIASGGVGSIEDIRRLSALPIWGVIVGRSLHEGKLDLSEAIRITTKAHG